MKTTTKLSVAVILLVCSGLVIDVYRRFLQVYTLTPNGAKVPASRVASFGRDPVEEASFRTKATRINRSLPSILAVPKQATGASENVEFLLQDPQFKSDVRAYAKSVFLRRYGRFFVSLNLSNDATQRMLDLMVDGTDFSIGESSFNLRPSGQSVDTVMEQMNAIWGNSGPQYLEYSRTYPVREVANDLSAALAITNSPITNDQNDKLTKILSESSSSYINGGVASKKNVDWPTVQNRAQTILSAEQMRFFLDQVALFKRQR